MSADPGKFVQTTTAPSRGALTTNFLTGSMSPLQYLQVRGAWLSDCWQPLQSRLPACLPACLQQLAEPACVSLCRVLCAVWCAAVVHVPCVVCCAMCCPSQSLDLPSYCGFNLLVGDLHSRQVAYVSNRDPQGPRQLGPGHYGEKCAAAAAPLQLPQTAPFPRQCAAFSHTAQPSCRKHHQVLMWGCCDCKQLHAVTEGGRCTAVA